MGTDRGASKAFAESGFAYFASALLERRRDRGKNPLPAPLPVPVCPLPPPLSPAPASGARLFAPCAARQVARVERTARWCSPGGGYGTRGLRGVGGGVRELWVRDTGGRAVVVAPAGTIGSRAPWTVGGRAVLQGWGRHGGGRKWQPRLAGRERPERRAPHRPGQNRNRPAGRGGEKGERRRGGGGEGGRRKRGGGGRRGEEEGRGGGGEGGGGGGGRERGGGGREEEEERWRRGKRRERSGQFADKDANTEEFERVLYTEFPKLKEAGGFDLLKSTGVVSGEHLYPAPCPLPRVVPWGSAGVIVINMHHVELKSCE
ncbi:hypothetical protein CRUP_032760, partial [Coryphaenoides rupestris]